MNIAIIGWGSLLWDPQDLQLATPFQPTGPNLPVEFCGVSKDHRLTLLIDEAFGTLCQTYAATSAATQLDEALENLRQREGMSTTNDIGVADITTGHRSPAAIARHPHAVETIADWTAHAGYDAAIWTALESHFETRTPEPFSVTAALRFLEQLADQDPQAFTRALTYIRRAPPTIQTPVRQAASAQWPDPPAPERATL